MYNVIQYIKSLFAYRCEHPKIYVITKDEVKKCLLCGETLKQK